MTVNLSALAGAGQQFLDDSGNVLTGGKLYSYAAGTTTPQTTYISASGLTAHSNPIILNAAGRVATGEIWLTSGISYKFVLYTSTDVLIASWDNITGIATNATNVEYNPPFIGAVTSGYTVSDKLEQSVSVKDFGAVGDGVADDTAAIQAAINASSSVTASAGDVYRVTAKIEIPSNRYLDFNGATFKRDFVGDYIFQNVNAQNNGAATDENITIKNARFIDYGRSDTSDFGPAIRFAWTRNIVIENIQVYFTSTQVGLTYGPWAIYVSAENARLTNLQIDNIAQGQQADGVHFGYVKNLVMSDFTIRSGDDSIALAQPPTAWSFEGPNLPSENIVIGNGYCESLFSAIRVGSFNAVYGASGNNCVWQNVLIHDIEVGQAGAAVVLLEDTRLDADVALQHKNITFDNIHAADQTDAFYLLGIIGDQNSTKVFRNVTFSNVSARAIGTSTNMMRVNSCEEVTFKNVNLEQAFTSPQPAAACIFRYIDKIVYENSTFKTHSSNNAFQYEFVQTIKSFDTNFQDVGNASQGVVLVFNTSFAISFWSIGGLITGYQRCITGSNTAGATNLFQDFVIDGTDIRGTVADLTNIITTAVPLGLNIRNLLERTVYSSGVTGGSGSAGVGAQYVSLTIGDTTYKILHDGTL
jgi:hypothetical protein